jgi:HAMP domain-containing protein
MAVLGTYLVVKCEQCGKKYGTSPEKLKKKKVTFPCKECGNIVTAIRPDEIASQPDEPSQVSMIPDRSETETPKSILSMGLTTKFLLFTILPLVLISTAVVFISDNRMRSLQRQTIDSSTEVVKNISENLIAQISETVARQTRQYLFSNADLRKENFNRDIYFKKVVLQKIGVTGSTSLYEIAGDKGAWLTWVDVDPAMVGKNMKAMTGELGEHFQKYWDIVTAVQSGKVSRGVYKWPDGKGNLREKFVVCTPIEGTPFVISASIFMDEITAPLEKIEAEGYKVAGEIRLTLMTILGGGLLLIFVILLVYGRSLTGKIKRLADWADAISLGRLDSKPVKLNSGDEIGELTEAITRMQESIRLSIEKLSRKKR